ncbi:MAG: prolipoprotein diacylglyceryl transferase [Simkania sp.]|nr:prolipoprotein diacylglyceryl transferase [Simkania sp.]
MIGYLTWDPPRELLPWNIPFLDRPILWYGFLFALGFFLGYLVFCYLLHREGISYKKANEIAEQFLLYIGLGAIIGARLGDVFFYQNPHQWLAEPLEILYIWQGGLSSHGAAVGILIALIFLTRRLKRRFKVSISFLKVLDYTVIPVALAGACIRIGNFINQEILGRPTELPWGIIFLHPADGSLITPRHPVQLYESAGYLVLFFLLLWLFKNKEFFLRTGKISGLFLVLLFGFRFFVEVFKEEQSMLLAPDFPFTMGQLLSIPLVLLGSYLLARKTERERL